MSTPNNNLPPFTTFHQWVAQRIQSFDFVAHPVVVDPFIWTLESDIESYVVEYLTNGRSDAEINQFLDLRNRIRDAPTPSGMSAQMREERDRRLLYEHPPDLSANLQQLRVVLDTQILTGSHWQERLGDRELMAGVSQEDVDALLKAREAIVHSCWVMLILDNMSLEQSRELNSQITQELNIASRIRPIISANRLRLLEESLDRARQDIEGPYDERQQRVESFIREHRELNGQYDQFLGRFMQSVTDNGSESESCADESEEEHPSLGVHTSHDRNSSDDKHALRIAELHGNIDSLVEELSNSSDEDVDSHVRHRPDWHASGNILGDCARRM